jgi:hypothetical protein
MATPLLLALVLVQGPATPAPTPQWTDQQIELTLGGAPELAQPRKVYVQSGSWLSQAPVGGGSAGDATLPPAARSFRPMPMPLLSGASSCYGTGYNSPDYGFYRGASDTDRSCQIQRSSDEQIAAKVAAGKKAQAEAARKTAATPRGSSSSSTAGPTFSRTSVPAGFTGQLPSSGTGGGGASAVPTKHGGGIK